MPNLCSVAESKRQARANEAHFNLVETILQQVERQAHLSNNTARIYCSFGPNDLLILRRYIHQGVSDTSPSIIAVNEIFTRVFVQETDKSEENNHYTPQEKFLSAASLLMSYLRKMTLIQFFFLFVAIVSAYELYVSAIARQHALISLHPSTPERCLPFSRQSFYTRMYTFFSSSNLDYCEKYFRSSFTHPLTALRPDRILYTILGELLLFIFQTLGRAFGLFYMNVNSGVPFYFAIPLTYMLICRFVYTITENISVLFSFPNMIRQCTEQKKPCSKDVLSLEAKK